MSSTIINKGIRWFKCDLHLHTTASLCFLDREVTAQQWVDRAIEQGLNCVAVTDHNTGLDIDEIKAAADGKELTVFPTHNANVPVNGDAEYIISMDTDSKILKVLHTGTVEQVTIKKEICDVMEGGEQAFEMRSKRYRQIK